MKFQLNKMTFSHRVTFFMLFWLMNVLCMVPAIAQKVHVDGKSSTVHQVMTLIESQTGYKFFYNNQVNLSRMVSIKAKNESLTSVLKRLFDGTNVSYKIIDKTIVLSIKDQKNNRTPTPANVGSTKKTKITGKVTDIEGEPIIGATIQVEGVKGAGAITDLDGHFSLDASENAKIIISYIGYTTKEVAVRGQKQIHVSLVENVKQINDVVVMAYGTQTKRDVTGSIGTIDFDDLSDIPAGQFSQKIQGKLAGVQVSQGTGIPGQGMSIKIRGAASLSTGATPLYVVDGFPIVGEINNINPNEIESMSILKDASATALYGSRAAFGVVMITTKKGKTGKVNVDVNAYMGIQSVPQKGRPDMMNGEEWAQFKKESYEDLGVAVPEVYQNPAQYGKGTDWYDAMLRNAVIQDYNVAIRGGSERFSTSLVLGYFNQDGVVLNSDYNRFSIRSNSEFNINKKVKLTFSVAPTYSFENRPSTDGAFFSGSGLLANAALTSPILKYQDENGNYPISVTTPGITSVDTPNWVRSIRDIKNRRTIKRLLANTSLEVKPIEGMLLKTSLGTDIGSEYHFTFQPSTAGRAFAAAPSAINANLFDANNRYYSWLWENTASYTKRFGNHKLDILGGFTVQRFRSDYSAISGSNFADDRVQTINAALVKNNPTQDIQEWSMVSFLGRINYNYKEKYLLSASIRRDGSSRFGKENRWGNFPAISAGWLVNEEKFMKSLDWLSLFKIRASYGVTGNNNIGNYTQYNVISNSNAVFGSNVASGIRVTNLGNVELGWEKTTEADFGVDLSVWNNRITFTYDYYNKTTRDLLYSLSVPRESGFSNFMGNVGKLRFWGHEFSINTHNLTGEFRWDTNFNISFSDNKVLALSGLSDQLIAYTGFVSTITKVGGRIGQFYGMIQDGVYKNQADYDNSPKAVDSEVGTIKFRDVNGDKVITYDEVGGDKTEIGNPLPKFTYGLTNTFYYKNIDLAILATGSYGNKIATPMEQGMTNLDGLFNVLKEVKDRWRSPENPGAGKYGKTTGGTGRERDQFHSRYVKDGSYFMIKNITLGYTLPKNAIKFVNSLRVYASIQQPFVFSKYKYGNPEVGTNFDGSTPSSLLQGIDYSTYPVPRIFTLGLNLSL